MDDRKYQEFIDYRHYLEDSRYKTQSQLDRDTLFLASGGLIVSLILFHRLIDPDTVILKSLFFCNWFLFVLPIVMIPISFILSTKAIAKQIQQIDRYYLQDDAEALKERNICAALTEISNWISLISLVLAFILFFGLTWWAI